MSEVRPPTVAGQFYERSPRRLEESLRECFLHRLGPGRLPEVKPAGPGAVNALVSPHAGYMFSGPAAAHGYAALAADGIPEAVVILGPSHHFPGLSADVSSAAVWATPLGEARVDASLREALLAEDDLFVADSAPTAGHSLSSCHSTSSTSPSPIRRSASSLPLDSATRRPRRSDGEVVARAGGWRGRDRQHRPFHQFPHETALAATGRRPMPSAP
jgi:hypothetical protein